MLTEERPSPRRPVVDVRSRGPRPPSLAVTHRTLASLRRSVASRVPISVRRVLQYRRVHGRFPALRPPQTFTEKVLWRILHDRRPLLDATCDKLRMKEHAAATAPSWVGVPATLWSGTDVRELAGVTLPEHWVLKPNHRTGLVVLGSGPPDVDALVEATRGWLEPEEWLRGGEWAYSRACPLLLVEERIGGPETDLTDYKVFVFDGRPGLVQTLTARRTVAGMRAYSPDWEYLGKARDHAAGEPVPRPADLEAMLEAAARIGAGFDFIRVDLYDHDGRLWFGELTPYPGSGPVAWEDRTLDRRVGSWWRLPRL